MKTLYSAKVTTEGGRKGRTTSDDGILDLQLSMPKSLGGEGGEHTNPEQLFAAGYSACFGSALEMIAKNANVDLGDYSVTVKIDIEQNDDKEMDLSAVIDVYIPEIEVEKGEDLINEAHEICPYSRATRDNIDVTLNLLIDED